MTTPTHLLTDQELDAIHRAGLPEHLHEDYVLADGDGKLLFTVKGLQAYKHAAEHFGLPSPFPALAHVDDLFEFQLDVQGCLLAQAQLRVRTLCESGGMDPVLRAEAQATLSGSLDEMLREASRVAELRACGANVFPLPRGKTATQGRG